LLKALAVEDSGKNERTEITADGVFIFIGLIPNTEVVKDLIALNDQGFIKTEGMGKTSAQGVFAACDCREGAIAQLAVATVEGVLASYGIKDFLKR